MTASLYKAMNGDGDWETPKNPAKKFDYTNPNAKPTTTQYDNDDQNQNKDINDLKTIINGQQKSITDMQNSIAELASFIKALAPTAAADQGNSPE